MTITREHLIDLARKETLQRADHSDVISGYLIGSVVAGNPLLGETADIDLVLIHTSEPSVPREAVRLSHQIHFDITHHAKDAYLKPSDLRVDPWLGPALCEPVFLHDPEHFFEWAQAGARGQFFRPDHIYARAKSFIRRARQNHSFLTLSNRWLKFYLRAAMDAANAVASLDRFPVSGRRAVLQLSSQAEHFVYPGLLADFQTLVGGDQVSSWDIPGTLASWARAYDTASADPTIKGFPECRRDYYLQGFQAMVEGGHADSILWPLLQIWERVMASLPNHEVHQEHFDAWNILRGQVGLRDVDQELRGQLLQAYIDSNAAWIESWATRTGA